MLPVIIITDVKTLKKGEKNLNNMEIVFNLIHNNMASVYKTLPDKPVRKDIGKNANDVKIKAKIKIV